MLQGPALVLGGLLAFGAVGCGHTTPFGPTPSERGPFSGAPDRLTFNVQQDILHGFSAQGTELFYTFCDDLKAEDHLPCGVPASHPVPTLANQDRCLGALPVDGGSRTLELCGSPVHDADSVKQFVSGTRIADGSLVFIYWTQRPTASFTTNAALYVWRPGAPEPVRLLGYRPAVDNLGVPSRVLAAGGDQVATIGGDGSELVTIRPDNSISREPVAGLLAVDAQTGERLLLNGGVLQRHLPSTGATTTVGSAAPEPEWEMLEVLAGGIAAGDAVLVQRKSRVVAGSVESLRHLIRFRAGNAPDTLLVSDDTGLGGLVMAPHGGSLVVQRHGDLYRYALP
jgi:hypothetical protein